MLCWVLVKRKKVKEAYVIKIRNWRKGEKSLNVERRKII